MDSLPNPTDTIPPDALSAAGAGIRDTAVAALGRRYAVLAERSKKRRLTDAERTELDRLELVIDTLQGMA